MLQGCPSGGVIMMLRYKRYCKIGRFFYQQFDLKIADMCLI